ncbi:biotin-requiring enzyme family protein [Mycobacteroides abscessus MAB_082312_2258]|nr:biotin-requiring enzyme family protein [Mycobacteroides abscessus MAB_082312_2258]
MAVKQFLLPDLGEGLTEADLISWKVRVGDEVKLNQVLADVETAKAMVELPSPFEGTVVALQAAENSTVAVGAPLISIEVAAAEPDTPANLVGYGPSESVGQTRRRRRSGAGAAALALVEQTTEPEPAVAAPAAQAEAVPPRAAAKPSVRKLAAELGVALELINGTGIGGSITRQDVEAYTRSLTARAPQGALAGRSRLPVSRSSRAVRRGFRLRECASTPPPPWCAARSPHRTSPSSSPST